MATANTSPKSARIETRVTQEQKELIERAAEVSGRTVSDFVLAHVEVAAKKVMEEHEKLPGYPEIPAILVGRLARDVNYPGVGHFLLSDAISRCVRVASEIAASLIVVESKGDTATRFYEKFGFISLPKLPDRMFLPMQTAEKL